MLVISFFAVGSMVSAFSASSTATPRSLNSLLGMMFLEMLSVL
jgi:hypothetical protein